MCLSSVSWKTKQQEIFKYPENYTSPQHIIFNYTHPTVFCKEGRVNRDVYYCFMAMKCGANAKPPSNDPCAACLGPGFISIMRSIYSVVMTWGYEKSQILLKTQAHPPNPVWKDGLIHRWNSHDMSAHTKWEAALAIIARNRQTGA